MPPVCGGRLGRLLHPFVVPGQISLISIHLVRGHSNTVTLAYDGRADATHEEMVLDPNGALSLRTCYGREQEKGRGRGLGGVGCIALILRAVFSSGTPKLEHRPRRRKPVRHRRSPGVRRPAAGLGAQPRLLTHIASRRLVGAEPPIAFRFHVGDESLDRARRSRPASLRETGCSSWGGRYLLVSGRSFGEGRCATAHEDRASADPHRGRVTPPPGPPRHG